MWSMFGTKIATIRANTAVFAMLAKNPPTVPRGPINSRIASAPSTPKTAPEAPRDCVLYACIHGTQAREDSEGRNTGTWTIKVDTISVGPAGTNKTELCSEQQNNTPR